MASSPSPRVCFTVRYSFSLLEYTRVEASIKKQLHFSLFLFFAGDSVAALSLWYKWVSHGIFSHKVGQE